MVGLAGTDSGEKALVKALKNTYSLIILGVQMQIWDGFEVAKLFLAQQNKRIFLLFFIRYKYRKRFITKGYKSGGIDYVTKPIDPDILLLKVKAL